jgi:hypothetical protein
MKKKTKQLGEYLEQMEKQACEFSSFLKQFRKDFLKPLDKELQRFSAYTSKVPERKDFPKEMIEEYEKLFKDRDTFDDVSSTVSIAAGELDLIDGELTRLWTRLKLCLRKIRPIDSESQVTVIGRAIRNVPEVSEKEIELLEKFRKSWK